MKILSLLYNIKDSSL